MVDEHDEPHALGHCGVVSVCGVAMSASHARAHANGAARMQGVVADRMGHAAAGGHAADGLASAGGGFRAALRSGARVVRDAQGVADRNHAVYCGVGRGGH